MEKFFLEICFISLFASPLDMTSRNICAIVNWNSNENTVCIGIRILIQIKPGHGHCIVAIMKSISIRKGLKEPEWHNLLSYWKFSKENKPQDTVNIWESSSHDICQNTSKHISRSFTRVFLAWGAPCFQACQGCKVLKEQLLSRKLHS